MRRFQQQKILNFEIYHQKHSNLVPNLNHSIIFHGSLFKKKTAGSCCRQTYKPRDGDGGGVVGTT